MWSAMSLQLLGVNEEIPRILAASILFLRVTDAPAFVNAALSLKLAYSSGSVYIRITRTKKKELVPEARIGGML